MGCSPQYPSATITVRGVGFLDFAHGQNGVVPNAIELHPVLEICFGHGCFPDSAGTLQLLDPTEDMTTIVPRCG